MSSPDYIDDKSALAAVRARWDAFYALHVYLPVSGAARSFRRRSHALRGRPETHPTHLPQMGWTGVLPRSPIRLIETAKRNGNVNLSEVAILAEAAAGVPPGSEIIEIGTFDGRTAFNLAVNAPTGVAIATLDLRQTSRRLFRSKPRSGNMSRSRRPAIVCGRVIRAGAVPPAGSRNCSATPRPTTGRLATDGPASFRGWFAYL